MLGNFSCFCCHRLLTLLKKTSFRNTIRVSNNLDPDQAQHFVRPDHGPNCLKRNYQQTAKVAATFAASKERAKIPEKLGQIWKPIGLNSLHAATLQALNFFKTNFFKKSFRMLSECQFESRSGLTFCWA